MILDVNANKIKCQFVPLSICLITLIIVILHFICIILLLFLFFFPYFYSYFFLSFCTTFKISIICHYYFDFKCILNQLPFCFPFLFSFFFNFIFLIHSCIVSKKLNKTIKLFVYCNTKRYCFLCEFFFYFRLFLLSLF